MNDEVTPRSGLNPGSGAALGAGVGSGVGVAVGAVTGEWWSIGVFPGVFIAVFVGLGALSQRGRRRVADRIGLGSAVSDAGSDCNERSARLGRA